MFEYGYVPDDRQFEKHCFIDINGQNFPIINGHVVDPVSKSKTKLEFFYQSDSDKMVHIDFEDALEEIKYSLGHHKCKVKEKKNTDVEDNHPFAFVCKKLEDLNKKIDDLMNANKDADRRLSDKPHENIVVAEVHREEVDAPKLNETIMSSKSIAKAKDKSSPKKGGIPPTTEHVAGDTPRPKYSSGQIESSGELSQEEFAKYLGLTQRKAFDTSVKTHSKKLRSKSNLLRNNESPAVVLPALVNKEHSLRKIKSGASTSGNQHQGLSKLEGMKKTPVKRITKKPDYFGNNSFIIKDKTQYTTEEDRVILDWVLRKRNNNKVNGNTIWQELEKKELPSIRGRSWQSLRNRFLKSILSQLKEYGLEKSDIHKIIHGAQKGTLVRRNKTPSIDKQNYGLISTKTVPNKVIMKGNVISKSGDSPKRVESSQVAKRKRLDVENHNVYSDVDIVSDEAVNMSYRDFKRKARSDGKKPLAENPAYTTRSKGRKLFTQRTFVASMSNNSTVG